MIHIDELKNMWIYKKIVHLPINYKNKRKGSAVILLTPNVTSSINMMKHPLLINKYHNGYYIEKDILYFINNENTVVGNVDDLKAVLEDGKYVFKNQEDIIQESMTIDITKLNINDYTINENTIIVNNNETTLMLVFNDSLEEEIIQEGSAKHNTILRKLLYNERFRKPKQVFAIYDKVKKDCPFVNRAYIDYKRYRGFNLFVDFYYYTETFFKNNMWKLEKGLNLYMDFLTRFLNDKRLAEHGYTKKNIFIPVHEWKKVIGDKNIQRYNEDINPISIINRIMRTDFDRLKTEWGQFTFVFFGEKSYFKVDFATLEKKDMFKFMNFINKLQDPNYEPSNEEDENIESPKSMVDTVIDKIESKSNIKINNLTGDGSETKDELVKRIEKAANSSGNAEEVMDRLEDDPEVKKMIIDISNQEDNTVKINASRTKRINKLKEDFLKKKLHDTTIEEIITRSKDNEPIPSTSLKIDTINEEWKELKYVNFENIYSVEEDLLKIVNDLSSDNKSNPVSIRDINIEDTSTSEDYVSTYTIDMEDSNGKRFKVVLDIPQFEDGKYLVLKGNRKLITRQLMLLPVVKTDEDTVQIVTNYNKLFLTRFGSKSFVVSDRLSKLLSKPSSIHSLKVVNGDNTRANSKYTIPIDYNELSSSFNYIDTKDFIFLFNQKEIRNKYKDIFKEKDDSFPFAYDKTKKQLLYCGYDEIFSIKLKQMLFDQYPELSEGYDDTNPSRKYTYTRVSILNSKIPLIVVLAYSEGLLPVLDKANVKYEVHEKRPTIDKDKQDLIKFNDGYIVYDITYDSSLLLNGLKECNTEDYSINEIDNKSTYVNFLDLFGGRIISDGLENFYELMIDPITKEVLQRYELPLTYTELMIYANSLLSDNEYVSHVDQSGTRYRSNEIVAACIYKALATAYGDYKNELKRGRKDAKMNMKRTEVIDSLLLLNIVSDCSDLSPILEAESLHNVSSKGPSGMNAERAYGLDKRAYHPSMLNLIGMSTPQGPGVGINRQTTIDMNIEGKRGYIKLTKDTDELSVTKTLTVSEAMTPFGVTRDDPPRTSMNLSQTKHTMRVKHSDPLLITNGVDEALPFLTPNTFSYKSKEDGSVIEKNDQYMIVKYKSGKSEFIDLRTKIRKNSSGGFYVPIKLDSDLKNGSRFKANEILAYDKESFSDKVGHTDDIACNSGTFAKIAILNTDDGYEDSAIISERMSGKMASDVVIKSEVVLGKNANLMYMVKKGQPIQEGDPLLIFQNSFEDEDVNSLLRNLVDDKDTISDIGRIPIKSKYTGIIEDIKIYRTVEKEELSPSLLSKVNELERPIKDIKKVLKKYEIEQASRFNEPDYKLDPTGKLKGVTDGILIEFYITYEDKMSVGDKLTFFIALKGVIKDIFPDGLEPYTDFRPEEKIDALLAIGSITGRQTCSIKMNVMINKVLVELSRSVKDILGIKYNVND